MCTPTDNQLIMLGTGYATATRCYNTCFVLRTAEGLLLVDGGGGNGILSQLEKAGLALSDIHDMFITHAHTDHILGAVWMVRMVAQRMKGGTYAGTFTLYSHARALGVLEQICRLTLPAKLQAFIGSSILFHELEDRDRFRAAGIDLQCFDIRSAKEKQFGFCAWLPGGIRLACLGDEPFNAANRPCVEGADWLLCEAFCLYRDREIFKPYEKHHSTALEAGELAASLRVRNLLLYHTEDRHLSTRREDYTEEAARNFHGRIVVPDDLEVIAVE